MNEENQYGFDMSISSFHPPENQGFDSFNASIDFPNNKDGSDFLENQPQKPAINLKTPGAQKNAPPGDPILSASSNMPTHGDTMSPKEDYTVPLDYGIVLPLPRVQQQQRGHSQDPLNLRSQSNDMDQPIFSFRPEDPRTNGVQPLPQINGENVVEEAEEESPRNQRNFFNSSNPFLIKLKKLYVFVLLNVICLGLLAFNITMAYKTEDNYFPKFQQIEDQFNQKVVLDVTLVPKLQNCSESYIPSKMGKWPGYKSICKCPSELFYRQCDVDDLKKSCSNIEDFKPKDIEYWNTKKICLKKSDKSFYEYFEASGFIESYSGNLLCPNSQKKCFISSSKNFICLGRTETCPLSQIEIKNMNDPEGSKLRKQIVLDSKVLAYENEGITATTVMDITVESDNCNLTNNELSEEERNKFCQSGSHKKLLDEESEYKVLKDNSENDASKTYEILKDSNNSLGLYVVPMNYLDMCPFNTTFNPIILNAQLSSWEGIKYVLFINPVFMTTLFMTNLLRIITIKYMNINVTDRILLKSKREIYKMFGKTLSNAALVATTAILTMIYYLLWGYLLIAPDRQLADKWLNMNCVDSDVRSEIEHMIIQLSQIQDNNMIMVGFMVFICVSEAILSQYRLISPLYGRIRGRS